MFFLAHIHPVVPWSQISGLARRWGKAFCLGFGLAGILVGILGVSPAYGFDSTVTRTDDPVPDGCRPDDCSLREAVMAANQSGGPGTIRLDAATYELRISGQGEDAARTGDLDISGHLTLTGVSSATTIVDAGGLDRVFDLLTGSLTLNHVTVQGGAAQEIGGGILNRAGSLHIADSRITSNTIAGLGGGICNFGTASLVNSEVTGNAATGSNSVHGEGGPPGPGVEARFLQRIDRHGSAAGDFGGGIHNTGALTLTRTTVATNQAGRDGGGIDNAGTLAMVDGAIFHNTATVDGGGISNLGILTATHATVTANQTGRDGGGIHNAGSLLALATTVGDNRADDDGGGIYNAGTLSITRTAVLSNTAGDLGGGISNLGVLTATHAAITGNRAATDGGGIDNAGTLLALATTIGYNRAQGAAGGVYNLDTLAITHATVFSNTAGNFGGGIHNLGVLTASHTTLAANQAATDGGGIDNNGVLFLADSTVLANHAGAHGGGIHNLAVLVVDRVGIVRNHSQAHGGGIYNQAAGRLDLANTTLSANTAVAGGGVHNSGILAANHATVAGNTVHGDGDDHGGGGLFSAPAGTAALQNTILAGNAGRNGHASNCSGQISSLGAVLVEDVTGCAFTPAAGDRMGDAADPLDPGLAPLPEDGIAVHALLAGSPALDAGNGAACASVDQRGVARPQGLACDIGAYESDSADLAVTQTAAEAVALGSAITFTIAVTNLGPASLRAVTVTAVLPGALAVEPIPPHPGSCTTGSHPLVCALGVLTASDDITLSLVVTPTLIGIIASQVTVAGDLADPLPANNQVAATTQVYDLPPVSFLPLVVRQ